MAVIVQKPLATRIPSRGFICRLARDRAGNTLALAAAALFPLLAIIGGGIDMSRGYLSQSRLQQACDSGVLAARKRLGTSAAVDDEIPVDAAASGNRFFNLNFRDGAYGTEDRVFNMILEDDFAITGVATVNVRTTLMAVFGYTEMSIRAEFQAQLNMANTDIMMVLYSTGSMAWTNPGDSKSRMETLKDTVLGFHTQLMGAAPSSSRVRFGFVPYSTNINVGHLLRDEWVNTSWKYASRDFDLESPPGKWHYRDITTDVSNWRLESNGCIEERETYEIADYDDVDLTRALDLDIDLVPTNASKTKWSPHYPHLIYARKRKYDGHGNFDKNPKLTLEEYVNPMIIGASACPAPAQKLATVDSAQMTSFLATLAPQGNTYHDIGMIWGGRLLSPSGILAGENADVSAARPTNRHLIFLTDGETAPRDISYSTYGVEPIDQRRWNPDSPLTLTQTVESRFAFACEEVKKRNITVWVISFGTAANPIMQTCAGADRYFVADDAEELENTFASIARRMGELRVTR